MTIQELQALRDSGKFHHATYRELGSIFEGLYIYSRKEGGFRGYDLAGCFGKNDSALDAAYELVRSSGVSVGAFGQG